MGTVLIKAFALMMIITMGYVLKKRGFFNSSDFGLISKIVLNITLPCAVITNFSRMNLDNSLLGIVAIGIVCNLLTIGIGYFSTFRKRNVEKAFHMINLSGYNIGSFTMPFVQNFLGPAGVVTTCLFDVGNAILCAGGTYALVSTIAKTGEKTTIKSFLIKLFSSVAMNTYLVMLLLSAMQVELPTIVTSPAEIVGASNAFLAMLMIGIGFELKFEKEMVFSIVKIIMIRYGFAVLLALLFYFVLPFPLEIRQVLVLISFAPVSSICTAFTEKCGGDVALSSVINSISIVLSITIMTTLLISMGIGA